jgi:O-acetylserine/cysteine efflux transporter
VSSVAVATQLAVPFSTILSIIFLNETVRWRRWVGIILAFSGVVVISFDPAVVNERLGLLLVVGAAFLGSVGTIIMKRIASTGVFQMQAWIAVFSVPILLLISFLFEQGQLQAVASASAPALGGIVYTALGASLIGHAGMYYLLQRYDVTVVSPLTLLAPIFGISFGVLVWGDELGLRFWIGSSVTLFGVFVIALRKREHAPEGNTL